MKKECVAMILAGGQGNRLGALTKRIAKPAVPFGGKYRIIDFTLSNCCNSKIDTVGILTQYRHMVLNAYVGSGEAWDLDRKNGGVQILPPYAGEKSRQWYRGTANSIYQNIDFIDQYNPEYLLVLSGDHIYKMDYGTMIEAHKSKGADVTISVMEVPWDEASRFGIMNTNDEGKIKGFEEKPEKPKNNLASMGIYIFNWKLLKKYLEEDDRDLHSSNDFGKDIIPKMLADRRKLYAYQFKGYWKDVGTLESFWEANMDLLSERPKIDVFDPKWRIYTANNICSPNFIGSNAKVTGSIVSDGCKVLGEVERSILFPGVFVGPGTKIKDSIVMQNAKIGSGIKIEDSIICEDAFISDGCYIGHKDSGLSLYGNTANNLKITVVGGGLVIPQNTLIKRGMNINSENIDELDLLTSNVS